MLAWDLGSCVAGGGSSHRTKNLCNVQFHVTFAEIVQGYYNTYALSDKVLENSCYYNAQEAAGDQKGKSGSGNVDHTYIANIHVICQTYISTVYIQSENKFMHHNCRTHRCSAEHQGADLNAFPRLALGSSPWINKGRVRHAVHWEFGVPALKHQALIILHTAPIEPLVLWVVLDSRCFSRPKWVSMLNADSIASRDRCRVGESQGVALHSAIERSPDVYDAVATLQELLGLVGKMVFDSLLGRELGLVDVRAIDGVATASVLADGVVEE